MSNNKAKEILAKFITEEKSYDLISGYTIIGEYKSTKAHHIHIKNASINAVLNITNEISAIYDVFSNDDILINNQTIKIEPLKWYNLDSKTNIQFGNVKCFFDTVELLDDDIIPCTQSESTSTNCRSRDRNSKKSIDSPTITNSSININENSILLNGIENDVFNFEIVPETQVNDYDDQFFNEDDDIEIPETQLPPDYVHDENSNETIIFHTENDSASIIQSQSQAVVNLRKSFDTSPKKLVNRAKEVMDCVDENDIHMNNDNNIINNDSNNILRIASVRSLSISENPILNFNDRSLSVTPDLIFEDDMVTEDPIPNLNNEILEDGKVQPVVDITNENNVNAEDMPDTQIFVPPPLLAKTNDTMAPPFAILKPKKNLNNLNAEQKLNSIYDQPTQKFEINNRQSSIEAEDNICDILTQKFIPSQPKTPESDKKTSDHDDIYIQMKRICESPKRLDSPSNNNLTNRKNLKRNHPLTELPPCKKFKIVTRKISLSDMQRYDMDDTVPFNYLDTPPNIKEMCEKLKDSISGNNNKQTINFLNNNFDNKADKIKRNDKHILNSKKDVEPKITNKRKASTAEKTKLSLEVAKKNDSSPSGLNDTKKSLRIRKHSDSFSNLTSSFDSTHSSRSLRVKYNILFTKISPDTYKEIVQQLGSRVVQKIEEATILVSNEANSTCKFLSAIGKGIPIVSPNWLECSKRANKLLEPADYILINQKNEKTYKYNIKKTIEKSNHSRVLEGFKVFSTPKLDILPADVETIVTMSGGEFYKNIKKYQINFASKTASNAKYRIIVISTKEDKSLWNQYKLLSKNVYIIDKDEFKMIILQHDINHIYKQIN